MTKFLFFFLVPLLLIGCKKDSCDDGELNQDESAIDCGGICAPCPSCADGMLNQNEVEIDCGGSCSPCSINYPESGTYGTNILNADTVNFIPDKYSMVAEIPVGSTLKIIMYSLSGGVWGYGGSQTNIIISSYTSSQTFEAAGPGLMQVRISLDNMETGPGSALIQFFENSETETKTKTITW